MKDKDKRRDLNNDAPRPVNMDAMRVLLVLKANRARGHVPKLLKPVTHKAPKTLQ